jgi:DNA-binding winged helix-turn-helix (wHTH) protein/tetratricopeptide (TPR) repeat protein
MSTQPETSYRFDEFELHPGRRTLTREGEKIPLAPKTFDVLTCLVANAGRVVTKDELLRAVWQGAFVEESNLTQHIFALRKALAGRADAIATIPGRGYQFTPAVQTIAEDLPVAPDSVPAQVSRRRSLRFSRWAAAAVIVIVASLVGLGIRQRLNGAVPGDHHEVVLADFENSTGDPELDHSLKTLLIIDLNQSPYFVVANDADTRKVLKLMDRPPDSDLTPPVARELCERLNDQVVLAGLIARFGQKYLVTLTATDCSDGKNLVQTKAVAKNRDGVIAAVDSVAADMRERLGEPLKSRHNPAQPLQMVHTFSLDALKAFSQGRALHLASKFAEAIPFYQRAIELDPNFSSAYAQLSLCYINLHQGKQAQAALQKAYDLRDYSDGLDRIYITSLYEYRKSGDQRAAIVNYRTFTQLYPRQSYPWAMLGGLQNSVGQLDDAIDSIKHAIELDPNTSSSWQNLAVSQAQDGRVEDAKATCYKAFARHFDIPDLHRLLINIAFLQHETATFNQQMAWFRANNSEADVADLQSGLDLSQGKYKSWLALELHVIDLDRKNAQPDAATAILAGLPRAEVDLGVIAAARAHLKQLGPLAPMKFSGSLVDPAVADAEVGDPADAQKFIAAALAERPHYALLLEHNAPQVAAAVDLRKGNPQQAIADLQPTLPYAPLDLNVPYLTGYAYLAAKQPDKAEAEFQKILTRPWGDPLSIAIPLAHLGLARAFAMQGNKPAARQEYETLFTLWKDADPDLPIMKTARQEYARLK